MRVVVVVVVVHPLVLESLTNPEFFISHKRIAIGEACGRSWIHSLGCESRLRVHRHDTHTYAYAYAAGMIERAHASN